jgi:hypothetical protein
LRRDEHYNGQKLKQKGKKKSTMVVKILDKKLNIKQDEQTKNGGQIVE